MIDSRSPAANDEDEDEDDDGESAAGFFLGPVSSLPRHRIRLLRTTRGKGLDFTLKKRVPPISRIDGDDDDDYARAHFS